MIDLTTRDDGGQSLAERLRHNKQLIQQHVEKAALLKAERRYMQTHPPDYSGYQYQPPATRAKKNISHDEYTELLDTGIPKSIPRLINDTGRKLNHHLSERSWMKDNATGTAGHSRLPIECRIIERLANNEGMRVQPVEKIPPYGTQVFTIYQHEMYGYVYGPSRNVGDIINVMLKFSCTINAVYDDNTVQVRVDNSDKYFVIPIESFKAL